jgi:hypothetical protein
LTGLGGGEVAFQSLWGNVMRKVLNYDAGGHGLHFSSADVKGNFCRRN